MASKASYFQKYLARIAAAAGRSTAYVSKQIGHVEAGLEEWVGDVRRIAKLERKALLAARKHAERKLHAKQRYWRESASEAELTGAHSSA